MITARDCCKLVRRPSCPPTTMSCSLCRLPFTPSNHSVAPRWPPRGVLTDKQLFYMKHAFGMGQYVIGLAVDLVNMGKSGTSLCSPPSA